MNTRLHKATLCAAAVCLLVLTLGLDWWLIPGAWVATGFLAIGAFAGAEKT